jgi:hypothetical protein
VKRRPPPLMRRAPQPMPQCCRPIALQGSKP